MTALAMTVVAVTAAAMARSERIQEDRAYVRRLLWERQPEFAAALASVERALCGPAELGGQRESA
jgi:hypothetical protein